MMLPRLLLVGLLAASPAYAASGAIAPVNLRCEHQTNPLAIEATQPRLNWGLESSVPGARGKRQTAYQILVASSAENLAADKADLWDSGRVESAETLHVRYQGKPLRSKAPCWWKVRAWDEQGAASGWSSSARWSMGLLSPNDWKAKWIGHTGPEQPLPLFRRQFTLDKPEKRALLRICGLGHYEVFLNGVKLGNQVLDPGWTNYRKRCLYTTYDLSGRLAPDRRNVLAVMLGNGMYNVRGGRYAKFTGSFGPPKLILQMDVEFADGTSTQIVSDATWRTAPGPITFSCVYGGEDYDARLTPLGWDKPGFDDSAWQPAAVTEGPGGRLTAPSAAPTEVMQVGKPVRVSQPKPGVFVYDMGQNASGWPSLSVRGPAGAQVRMTPAELIMPDGTADQRSSGSPCYFTYALKGDGVETWRPQFTYYGFRYVQVEGALPAEDPNPSGKPVLQTLQREFLRNSAARVGSFACSNRLFNQIHALIDWSVGSNLQSVLTDCPHREKLGWLEVAHLMAPSMMYNYDLPRFWAKIADDMGDSQLADGLVPDIAPEYTVFPGGFRDSPEWGSAYVIIPWYAYQWYGDLEILRTHYDGMRRYVDYLTSRSKDHLVSHGLGDWCDYGPKPMGVSQWTPLPVTATAIYYSDIVILAEAARLLGKGDDARKYAALGRDVRGAFNKAFFQAGSNQYATGSQTSNAMPLVLGMVEPDRAAAVLENIVRDVHARGDHLTSGDVGHRFLLRALADGLRSDVVFQMTNRTTVPSYGCQILKGATSLTEAWDARPGMSHNHCMLGHAEEWLYRDLGGIQNDPRAPAFQRIVIRPQVVGDLTWVKASYVSIRGAIASHWERKANRLTLAVTIPVNTTATIYVPTADPASVSEGAKPAGQSPGVKFLRAEPGAAVFEVGSGQYTFTGAAP